MRDFSKVSPSLHNSERFRALGRDYVAKHVYQYLITCPHGNSVGCFTLKDGYACDDLDMELEAYRKAIDSLCEVGLIAFDKAAKTVSIAKWLDHNAPTNSKHALGMLSVLAKGGTDALFAARFVEFKEVLRLKRFTTDPSVRNAIDSLSERYAKPIESLSPLETETETRQRLDGVDQTETREEVSRPAHRVPATLTGGTLAPVVVDDQPSPPSGMPKPLTASEQGAASRLLSTSIMRRVS